MLQTAQRLATTVLPALAISVPGLFPAVAGGQDDDTLDTLIFEPVLLDVGKPVSGGGDPVTTAGRLQEMASLEAGDIFPPAGEVTAAERLAAIAAYEEDIAALERTEGQYAATLTEKLLSLGRLLQQQDDHSRAITVFERADHISRVNNGLYHPEQMAIVERQVESYLALGDFAAVNDKQHYLLYLSRKLDEIGGLARVPALAGLGDQNMYAFDLALLEQRDDAARGSFRPGGMEAPGAPEIARYHAINSLFRAKSHYSDAIATLIENSSFLNPRLL
ncbi:MAG TPA: hypothetical protein VLA15_01820, partial [Desulfurivibrionaceae bacterium]|nr:hypothetical protein [Desulfurivibrionaceae bacterium]